MSAQFAPIPAGATDGETGSRFDLATATEIRFGAGRAHELPDLVQALGVVRVAVVTGANPARAEPLCQRLRAAGARVTVVAVPGEPSVDLIGESAGRLRAADCEAVIGYGGGSALDAAKALAALTPSGTDPLEHLEVIGAGRPLAARPLPCIAVPTTAGTGSEVTRNSVLSHHGVKASLRSPLMLPRVAVVDPDLLAGLPAATIAASGSDALTQLIEPYLSTRANPFTDALAREGIQRSARALRRAHEQGLDDPKDREDLALASLFGGLCLANSGLGAVHGFAAVLGARYDAPHGAVCGALASTVLATNLKALRERAPRAEALARIEEIAGLLTGDPAASADQAPVWLADQQSALGVPGLAAYGVRAEDVDGLVAQAGQASSMKANPLELTHDELRGIILGSL
ncbi:MAG: iron-containing alcohol dehydrogenase [Actinomycetales bacterium]